MPHLPAAGRKSQKHKSSKKKLNPYAYACPKDSSSFAPEELQMDSTLKVESISRGRINDWDF